MYSMYSTYSAIIIAVNMGKSLFLSKYCTYFSYWSLSNCFCVDCDNKNNIKLFKSVTDKKNNSPFHSSWKVTKPLHETKAKVKLAQLEKWK